MSRYVLLVGYVLVLLALVNTYDPLTVLPLIGVPLTFCLDEPIARVAHWVTLHWFHLSGIAAIPHASDSRDTALGWITLLVTAALAFVGASIWALILRCESSVDKVLVWLRYLIRMSLVFVMFRYAIFKIFPLQMSPPSLAVLNEPVGETSPMTLLWTLVGLSPTYQIASGLFEALAACLLLFRRTALIGVLIGVAVMTNVVLLNFCFDVPVKLGASLILMSFAALLWSDISALFGFFLGSDAVKLKSDWEPCFNSRRAMRLMMAAELGYTACILYAFIPASYLSAVREAGNRRSPSSITGEWHVDSARRSMEGHTQDAPVLTAEGLPMTAIYFEPDGRVMARSADGRLWRAGATIDSVRHTVSLYSGYFDGTRFEGTYSYNQPDESHLQLVPTGSESITNSTLLLTRIPLLTNYPLLDRDFHWVEEWALER